MRSALYADSALLCWSVGLCYLFAALHRLGRSLIRSGYGE
jgi:hypothetical protein